MPTAVEQTPAHGTQRAAAAAAAPSAAPAPKPTRLQRQRHARKAFPATALHPQPSAADIDALLCAALRASAASSRHVHWETDSELCFNEMRRACRHGHADHPQYHPLPLLPHSTRSSTPPPHSETPLLMPEDPVLSADLSTSYDTAAATPTNLPQRRDSYTTICSVNTGGFAPRISDHARKRHNAANGASVHSNRPMTDFDHGDGTDGTYELSYKQQQVLTGFKAGTSLYAIQEFGANATMATITRALFKEHGLECYISVARPGDPAAGLVFLWRPDVWTLVGTPSDDYPGRISTITLLNSVDKLTYEFTNVYLFQAGKDAKSKSKLGEQLITCAKGKQHGYPYYVMGDFNGQPEELCRYAATEPNTATYSALLDVCHLSRLNNLAPTYHFSARDAAPTHEVDWLHAKDDATADPSVKACDPNQRGACAADLTANRLVLLPVEIVDPFYAHANANRSESTFVTLEVADSNDSADVNGKKTHNADRSFRIHVVAESAPPGMVQSVNTIKWGALYPPTPHANPNDAFIRVKARSFNPFKKYATTQLIDLHAKDRAAAPADAPPTTSNETLLAMAQRRLPATSSSTVIDAVLGNTVAKNMCTATSLGAPIHSGRPPRSGPTGIQPTWPANYHLSINVTTRLLSSATELNDKKPRTGRLKLKEMPLGDEGWPQLQFALTKACALAISKLAKSTRTNANSSMENTATPSDPLLAPPPSSLPTAAAGDHPLITAAANDLQTALEQHNSYPNDSADATDKLMPSAAALMADIRRLGPIDTLNATFAATNATVADHLGRSGTGGRGRTPSAAETCKHTLDTLVNMRSRALLRASDLDAEAARHVLGRPNKKTLAYMRSDHMHQYVRELGAVPPSIRALWPNDDADRNPPITNAVAAKRAHDEEQALSKLVATANEQLWETIHAATAKSQDRRLNELLNKADRSNFVALTWQHWNDEARNRSVAPAQKPLQMVRDKGTTNAPAIPPADPRYKEIVQSEYSTLWAKGSVNSKSIEFLIELTGLRTNALPTITMEALVADACTQTNIDLCLRKIRADSATGPDTLHGYCVRKAGPVAAAIIRYAITVLLLHGNVDLATSCATLALVHKPGRDPFDATKGYRPLVVFNHIQALIERVLQQHFNRCVGAIRSNCQAGYLPHTCTPSLTMRLRCSSELAAIYRAPRVDAACDARSFFDTIQLDVQTLLEAAIGINPQASERVRRTTATTLLRVNTAAGPISDIPVKSGAGQGRALATSKSLAVLALRERFAAHTAAGERFPGRCNSFVQHCNQAFADDESSSDHGPLASQLVGLAQEASTVASDLILGCPNNPDKSVSTSTVWNADGSQRHLFDEEIILPNGHGRTPACMYATNESTKIVGIHLANGIHHTQTDDSRARTIKAFNKKVGSNGGLLLPELNATRAVISQGVNAYKCRPTISDPVTSAGVDKLVRADDVAAGFCHSSTKNCVRHGPCSAYGLGASYDEASARAAFADDYLRTLNLPSGVPWRDALESTLVHWLWLCGHDHGCPLHFTPPTTCPKAARSRTAAFLYETLDMAGRILVPTRGPSNGALDPSRWAKPEAALVGGVPLWFGIRITDTVITTSQRLVSLGLRDVLDLVVQIAGNDQPTEDDLRPPQNRCILASAEDAQLILCGLATGNTVPPLSPAEKTAYRQLLRELHKSPIVRSALAAYALANTLPPHHTRLALLMNSDLGCRPITVDAARTPRPAGCARTRPLDDDIGQPADWTHRRRPAHAPSSKCRSSAVSQPMYLVRTAANMWCGSEGTWLTHKQIMDLCASAATALSKSNPDAVFDRALSSFCASAERAIQAAIRHHTIPGPFYDEAAASCGGECNGQGNVWQRLYSAEPAACDGLTKQLAADFVEYAARKSHPRKAAHNGSRDTAQRASRQHNVPSYQTFLRGYRDANGKQRIGNQPSVADVDGKLLLFNKHDNATLLQIEAQRAAEENRTPLGELLSERDDRFFAADDGDEPDPYVCNEDILRNPITASFVRDIHMEGSSVSVQTDASDAAPAAASHIDLATAHAPDGQPFEVRVKHGELEGASAAADKQLAMVLLAIQICLGTIDLIRFTDGALFPSNLDPRRAKRTGWGYIRSAPRRDSRFSDRPRYVGGALTSKATISRAELAALLYALDDLAEVLNDYPSTSTAGGPTLVICMDSDSCAVQLEATLRSGNLEGLTDSSDAQLVETFTNRRTELERRGCRIIIIKIPGHANEEHGIGGITPQSYADGVAKAAAWLNTVEDPPLCLTRGCVAVATCLRHQVNTDPDDAYSTIAASTRTVKSFAEDIQAYLARDALHLDDKRHDATTGRSVLDRVLLGIDPSTADEAQLPDPANMAQRWPKPPQPPLPDLSPTNLRLNLPTDTHVWRQLVEDMCSGKGVRRHPSGACSGYAWLGQTIGGGSITYRCKTCPCGGIADARHIISGECSIYKIPPNLRTHLANTLCQSTSREQAKTGYVPSAQANKVAAAIERASRTLFSNTPVPRNEAGWCAWTRGVRVLCGGLPMPDADMMRAMKQHHERLHYLYDPKANIGQPPSSTNHPTPPATADDKPAVWNHDAATRKLIAQEFQLKVLTDVRQVRPPPLLDPEQCQPASSASALDDLEHAYGFRPSKAATFARQSIMLNLRYIWNILAKALNYYEQCLLAYADKRDKIEGKNAEEPHENDAYIAGMTSRNEHNLGANKTFMRTDDASSANEQKHDARRDAATAAAPATARVDVNRVYSTGGFGMRRFNGPAELDRAATAALTAAHDNGTDGLPNDPDSRATLRLLASTGDIYASMQLDILESQPPAAHERGDVAAPRHLTPPHLDKAYEAKLLNEASSTDHFKNEIVFTMNRNALADIDDSDEDDDMVNCIVGWSKLAPPTPPAVACQTDAILREYHSNDVDAPPAIAANAAAAEDEPMPTPPAADAPPAQAPPPPPSQTAEPAEPGADGDDEAESSNATSEAADTPLQPQAASTKKKKKQRGRDWKKPMKRQLNEDSDLPDDPSKRPNTPEFAATRPPLSNSNTGAGSKDLLPLHNDYPAPLPANRPTKRLGSPSRPPAPKSRRPPTKDEDN